MTKASYDELLEASAENLLLVVRENSRDGSTVSGYTSDTEASLAVQEGDTISVASSSNYSSSVSSCTLSDSEGDTIESEISFLHQKQSLLKRALIAMQREEAYAASTARETLSKEVDEEKEALWTEAIEILDILDRRDNKPTTTRRPFCAAPAAKSSRPTKRAKIDLSSVHRISSSTMEEDECSGLSQESALSFPFKIPGPWMSKVLSGFVPTILNIDEADSLEGWKTANDPNVGKLVIPPSNMSLKGGMLLKDALHLSFEPRLLCQSTPPFAVVHINKAFCVFSGLEPQNVVGKPVQTILSVDEKIDEKTDSFVFAIESETSPDIEPAKAFGLHAHPVLGGSKKGISHLLLKLAPNTRDTCGESLKVSSLLEKAVIVHEPNKMFETVG